MFLNEMVIIFSFITELAVLMFLTESEHKPLNRSYSEQIKQYHVYNLNIYIYNILNVRVVFFIFITEPAILMCDLVIFYIVPRHNCQQSI